MAHHPPRPAPHPPIRPAPHPPRTNSTASPASIRVVNTSYPTKPAIAHTAKKDKEKPAKPLIQWLAKKLGQGKSVKGKSGSTRGVGGGSGSIRPRVSGEVSKGILNTSRSGGRAGMGSTGVRTPSIPLPRELQRTANRVPSIKLQEGRPASTRTRNSGRSYHPPAFNASRYRNYPRASTFMTRSSASPTNSPSISRTSSTRSYASSFLDIDDPDGRSYVEKDRRSSVADEDASLRPFPPSHPPSPSPSTTISLPSSTQFRADLTRGIVSVQQSAHSTHPNTRSRSASQSTSTSSSFTPSKAWRSVSIANSVRSQGGNSASTKPTTVFSTDSQVIIGMGGTMAHIAEPHPSEQAGGMGAEMGTNGLMGSQGVPHGGNGQGQGHSTGGSPPINMSTAPPTIHRTLTWDSQLSASPSVPSPLGIASLPFSPSNHPEMPEGGATAGPSRLYQAPHLSRHHPRDNPKPNSPPSPNASIITLASSNFASPVAANPGYAQKLFGNNNGSADWGMGGHGSRSIAGTIAGSIATGIWDDSDGVPSRRESQNIVGGVQEMDGAPATGLLGPPIQLELGSQPMEVYTPGQGDRHDVRDRRESRRDSSILIDLAEVTPTSGVNALPTPVDHGGSLLGPASSYYFPGGRGRDAADDESSMRAMRRRGSSESGISRFSWAGGLTNGMGTADTFDGSLRDMLGSHPSNGALGRPLSMLANDVLLETEGDSGGSATSHGHARS